jgi:hypothetical protein
MVDGGLTKEECLQRAKQAEASAKATADPRTKKSFLDAARQWARLADLAKSQKDK